ncbi:MULTISPECIES: envelope stress response membrane protein PspB [unclassified Sphingomonas]|jgi:phage shock protein B|uniref:envelope stress response membrane protein PspB n=1 Tax=unclassified Sphingomonas TaxID=196159 RepID=UPI000E106617|nr:MULTISPECIES: envelope stress response membrane protein PspB [unclassified Sphingomonas]AXJ94228.1 envelope stress response membrane protein PspB [Sphingomonas sp. FARSPH]
MEDVIVPLIAITSIFIGLPWVIFHYITKWKQAPKITDEDEKLLDEMYNLARRLEDRLNTVERIVAADNPDFRTGLGAEIRPGLDRPAMDRQSDYRLEGRM